MSNLAEDITVQESVTTLADATEDYMLERMIFNEKYYPSYLKYAANAWSELFHDTLYIYNARWLPLESINGRYIIRFPKDCRGFISANVLDECNLVKRIPMDSRINVIPKPNPAACSCSSLIAGFVSSTKFLFNNAGVDYYQTQYLQYCPNGDIIERTVTPTKKYADFNGDTAGDYNPDYNNDYNVPVFGNFTIENIEEQRVIVNLDTDEQGRPQNTSENVNRILSNCGCYSHYAQHCCGDMLILPELNVGCFGSVNMAENSRSLIYTPPSHYNRCYHGAIPDYVLVYFKGSALGNEVTGAAIIPDDWFIKNALTLGIDHYMKRLNGKYNRQDKIDARAAFDHSINEIIRSKFFMNLATLTQVTEPNTIW